MIGAKWSTDRSAMGALESVAVDPQGRRQKDGSTHGDMTQIGRRRSVACSNDTPRPSIAPTSHWRSAAPSPYEMSAAAKTHTLLAKVIVLLSCSCPPAAAPDHARRVGVIHAPSITAPPPVQHRCR